MQTPAERTQSSTSPTERTTLARKKVLIGTKRSVYVSSDGNYGNADELALISRVGWTTDDEEVFEEFSESERWDYAIGVQLALDAGERTLPRPAIWAVDNGLRDEL